MKATAKHYADIATTTPQLLTATIVLAADNQWVVDTGIEKNTATRAASCLLRPAVHDSVLCVQLNSTDMMILAVLKQANPQQQHYDFSPTTSFTTSADTFAIRANNITLNSVYATTLHSDTLGVQAQQGTLTFRLLEQHAEHQQLYAKRSIESIQELKHQILGDLHTLVKKDYRLDSERVSIFADDLLKLEAEQITMS